MVDEKKILIADDLQDMRTVLTNILGREGYKTETAKDGLSAVELVRKEPPAAVIMDIRMPEMNGMEAMKQMKKIYPAMPIILMTAYGEIETAVQAVKFGAYDYISKPFENEKIVITLKNALSERNLKREVEVLRINIKRRTSLSELMGSSVEIKGVYNQVNSVSPTNFTVVLYGETGSGKELLARAIHNQSSRRECPFVAVDCGAIPETLIESELFGYEKGAFTGADRTKRGYFELSNKGTLYLDEISNLPKKMQSKLLRAIDEQRIRRLGGEEDIEIDIRVLVASNIKLENLVNTGKFREDLYHRLNEFVIEIPALRNRKEDVLYLSNRFLDEVNLELHKSVKGFSESATKYMLSYNWPGNVRELRNVVRRAVLQAVNNELIETRNLSANISKLNTAALSPLMGQSNKVEMGAYDELSLKEIVKKRVCDIEKHVIMDVLKFTGGNKSKAARILKVDYKTMYYKVKEYGINFEQ